MGSDDSRFNVSSTVRDKVTGRCPQTTIFEDKGEPKRFRQGDKSWPYIYRSMGQVLDPSLISLMVSVDVKHHIYLLKYPAGGPRSQEVGSRAEQGSGWGWGWGGWGGGGELYLTRRHAVSLSV